MGGSGWEAPWSCSPASGRAQEDGGSLSFKRESVGRGCGALSPKAGLLLSPRARVWLALFRKAEGWFSLEKPGSGSLSLEKPKSRGLSWQPPIGSSSSPLHRSSGAVEFRLSKRYFLLLSFLLFPSTGEKALESSQGSWSLPWCGKPTLSPRNTLSLGAAAPGAASLVGGEGRAGR